MTICAIMDFNNKFKAIKYRSSMGGWIVEKSESEYLVISGRYTISDIMKNIKGNYRIY